MKSVTPVVTAQGVKATKNVRTSVKSVINALKIPTLSKGNQKRINNVNAFKNAKNKDVFSNWKRLGIAKDKAIIETFSFSKALKVYLTCAEGILTPSQIKCLKHDNVLKEMRLSKYKNLPMFSFYQIQLICNNVVKKLNGKTKADLQTLKEAKKVR
tara:strand:- start:763 stop:1230 length:468 start_codon:yes stop_codon:yes gene_type:complete